MYWTCEQCHDGHYNGSTPKSISGGRTIPLPPGPSAEGGGGKWSSEKPTSFCPSNDATNFQRVNAPVVYRYINTRYHPIVISIRANNKLAGRLSTAVIAGMGMHLLGIRLPAHFAIASIIFDSVRIPNTRRQRISLPDTKTRHCHALSLLSAGQATLL